MARRLFTVADAPHSYLLCRIGGAERVHFRPAAPYSIPVCGAQSRGRPVIIVDDDKAHHACPSCAHWLDRQYFGPACGHSACRQNYIDTGERECVQGEAGRPA